MPAAASLQTRLLHHSHESLAYALLVDAADGHPPSYASGGHLDLTHELLQKRKMADEGEVSAVVCDNGSGVVKVCRPRDHALCVPARYRVLPV